MEDQRVKHLELIQAVTNRVAQNSFAYKAWMVSLVAAIFVLAMRDGGGGHVWVALIPTVAFWGLDAYYLRQERLFRRLYDAVREADEAGLSASPFTMDTSPYEVEAGTWWATCWSKSVAWLYGPMTVLILIVACLGCACG